MLRQMTDMALRGKYWSHCGKRVYMNMVKTTLSDYSRYNIRTVFEGTKHFGRN